MQCQVCGRPDAAVGCRSCQALFYCTPKHRHMHATRGGHDVEECSRMKAQMQHAKNAELTWLTWWSHVNGSSPPAVTDSKHPEHPLCSLLQAHGYHQKGIWQHVCPCRPVEVEDLQLADDTEDTLDRPAKRRMQQHPSSRASSSGSPGQPSQHEVPHEQKHSSPRPTAAAGVSGPGHELQASERGACTAGLSVHPSDQPTEASLPTSWQHLYHLRGLPPDSPAALALHFAMTAWLALASADHLRCGQLLQPHSGHEGGHEGEHEGGHEGGHEVHLLYLGPQSELGMLETFEEVVALLPQHTRLSIHFVGPDVPSAWHRRQVQWPCKAAAHAMHPFGKLPSDAPQGHAEAGSGLMGCSDGKEQWWKWLRSAGVRGSHVTSVREQPKQSTGAAWRQAQQVGVPTGSAEGTCPTIDHPPVAGAMASTSNSPAPKGTSVADESGVAREPACRLKFSFWQALLHEVDEELVSRFSLTADRVVVLMPNGGLAAYLSWIPTLQLLLAPSSLSPLHHAPIVATDYCEEALCKAQAMVKAVCEGEPWVSDILLNPFRQPYQQTLQGNALPSYSNGFMLFLGTQPEPSTH